jgi:hypothetical protein
MAQIIMDPNNLPDLSEWNSDNFFEYESAAKHAAFLKLVAQFDECLTQSLVITKPWRSENINRLNCTELAKYMEDMLVGDLQTCIAPWLKDKIKLAPRLVSVVLWVGTLNTPAQHAEYFLKGCCYQMPTYSRIRRIRKIQARFYKNYEDFKQKMRRKKKVKLITRPPAALNQIELLCQFALAEPDFVAEKLGAVKANNLNRLERQSCLLEMLKFVVLNETFPSCCDKNIQLLLEDLNLSFDDDNKQNVKIAASWAKIEIGTKKIVGKQVTHLPWLPCGTHGSSISLCRLLLCFVGTWLQPNMILSVQAKITDPDNRNFFIIQDESHVVTHVAEKKGLLYIETRSKYDDGTASDRLEWKFTSVSSPFSYVLFEAVMQPSEFYEVSLVYSSFGPAWMNLQVYQILLDLCEEEKIPLLRELVSLVICYLWS